MPEPEKTPAELRMERLRDRWKKDQETGEASGSDDPDPNPGATEPPTEEEKLTTAVADPTEAEPKGPAKKGTVAGKDKLQPYVDADVAERARNAWWRTRSLDDGFDTFSDLIETAIREKVEQLEREHNGGKPFTPRPRKRLSSGRPVGR